MRYTVFAACALALLGGATLGCDSEEGEGIGPRGGEVVSADGRFSLDFPDGALNRAVEITIEQRDCEVAALGTCYEVHPPGRGLLRPARATFEIGGMELGGFELDELALAAKHGKSWDQLADRHIDAEDEVVEASALYLSSFALVSVE